MAAKNTRNLVIAIDGPAGAGKSSAAKRVARALAVPFLDTGAIYRSITLWLDRLGIPPIEDDALKNRLAEFSIRFGANGEVFMNGEDVSNAIRTQHIDSKVSPYSALKSVRAALLGLQREQASSGLVAEGRDMGSVVFPDADLKIYLSASAETRARRRYDERVAKGESADYDEILHQVKERDFIDSTRETAPLVVASDAVQIDSSDMTLDEVVERILLLVGELEEQR